jgi:hypothetical protein
MSYSYDPSMSDNVSKIRFYIQDTFELAPFFQDEEIQALLDMNDSDLFKTAAQACFALYTKFAQSATVAEIDDVRIEARDRYRFYKDLSEKFEAKALKQSGRPIPVIIGGADRKEFIARSEGREYSKNPAYTVGKFFDNERN